MAKTPDKKQHLSVRIRIVQVFLVLLFCAVGIKAINIQVFESSALTLKDRNDYVRHITIEGERGQILDRNLNKLASSAPAATISAHPKQIKNPKDTARKLAGVLGVNRRTLEKKLTSRKNFVWLAKKAPPATETAVRELAIQGITIEKDSRRSYPNRSLAAQVIGFTGNDSSGLEGLEFKFNPLLEGQKETVRIEKTRKGGLIELTKTRKPQLKGRTLVLTIDKKIQFMSEQALETAVKKYHAKSGMALVMRPKTGELLAIAHYPSFNPNDFRSGNSMVFRNRAFTDSFEPGSVMKVFTASAALEKGLTPITIFDCKNGTYQIGSLTVHDTHPNDWLTINQIIKYSSNIGAVRIVETIGDEALYNYLKAFGFGEKTNIDHPVETAGILRPYEQWSRIDAGAISFGQGVSVSAVQLITAISAVANDGVLMKPLLVKKILSGSGAVETQFEPQEVRRVISRDTAQKVKKMMKYVVTEEGTGFKAALNGYTVCGKTGTAQKAKKGSRGYSNSRYTAVFSGFAPMDNPQLAILVVVDEPWRIHHGGEVAAPAFKTILENAFVYLNVPPSDNAYMFAQNRSGGTQ